MLSLHGLHMGYHLQHVCQVLAVLAISSLVLFRVVKILSPSRRRVTYLVEDDSQVLPWEEPVAPLGLTTDQPRNQTMVDTKATRWDKVLPHYTGNATMPSDRLWMPISGSHGGFVYSAFLDDRFLGNTDEGNFSSKELFVRVIGYVPSDVKRVYCRFHYGQEANMSGMSLETTDPWTAYQVMKSNPVQPLLMAYYPFGTIPDTINCMFYSCPPQYHSIPVFIEVMITCPVRRHPHHHRLPSSVSIYPDGLAIVDSDTLAPAGNNLYINHPKQNGGAGWSLAFCIKSLRAIYANATYIMEFVEFHTMLTERPVFHFYGITYSKQVECLLSNHYAKENSTKRKVYFHNNEMPRTQDPYADRDTENMLVMSPHNDCLYRNIMDGVPYIAFIDIDEMIVPSPRYFLFDSSVKPIDRLMEHVTQEYPKAAAFQLGRQQFPLQWPDQNGTIAQGRPQHHKVNLSSLAVKFRSSTKFLRWLDSGLCQKLIVIADRVTGIQSHWISGATRKEYESAPVLDEEVVKIHHYKISSEFAGLWEQFCNDTVIADVDAFVYWRKWQKQVRDSVEKIDQTCGKNWKEEHSDVFGVQQAPFKCPPA